MITIQSLLDLGILTDTNYQYTYDDEYDKVVDYAYKNEAETYNDHLIIVDTLENNSGVFTLTIVPDEYLKCKYNSLINAELIDAVQSVRVKCNSISCKECPYYTNTKPNGSPFENCKLTKSVPYLW